MPHSTSCKNAKIFISPSHPKTCANDLPCETRDQKCTSSQNLIQSGVEWSGGGIGWHFLCTLGQADHHLKIY